MTRIPDDLRRKLKVTRRNNRQLNRERLARLRALVRPDAGAVAALLTRIRRRHEALGPIDLSEGALRELRDDGRP